MAGDLCVHPHGNTLYLASYVLPRAGFGDTLILQNYGEEFRYQRKLVSHSFSPSVIHRYYDLQEAAARRLVLAVLEDPDSLGSSTRLYVYGEQTANCQELIRDLQAHREHHTTHDVWLYSQGGRRPVVYHWDRCHQRLQRGDPTRGLASRLCTHSCVVCSCFGTWRLLIEPLQCSTSHTGYRDLCSQRRRENGAECLSVHCGLHTTGAKRIM